MDREKHLRVHTDLKVVPSEAAHILDDDDAYFVLVDYADEPLPIRSVEIGPTVAIVHEIHRIREILVISVLFENGLLIHNGVTLPVKVILVIGWERGFEQNPHAGPGRAVFRIGIHPCDDVLGHIRQHTVLDTAVDVDGADVPEDADADTVISGPVSDGYGIIREGGLIRRIRTEAVRLIRHLGPVPVTLLIFPEVEGTSFL